MSKTKKDKTPLEPGAKKLRMIFILLFIGITILGISLGVLTWYDII